MFFFKLKNSENMIREMNIHSGRLVYVYCFPCFLEFTKSQLLAFSFLSLLSND